MMPPSELLGEGREVRALGAAQPDVEHIDTAVRETALQRRRELRAREPDVVSDGHRFGFTNAA